MKFPSSWKRADFPMFPRIVNPRSILALATFAIPRGAGKGECGYVPSQVRDGVGRSGAAILVTELYASPGGFRKLGRRMPKRPTVFHPLDKANGERMPGASDVWIFHFREHGRLLTASAVLGPDAPPELRRDVAAVLDSLRFDERRKGGVT